METKSRKHDQKCRCSISTLIAQKTPISTLFDMEIGQIASYMQKSAENTTKMQEFKGGMSVRPFLPPKHPKIDLQNTPSNTTLVERERSTTKQTCHKTHQDRRRDVEAPFKLIGTRKTPKPIQEAILMIFCTRALQKRRISS
ncbi:hypothetical protein AZ09_13990 [Acetobacter aceti 1023]|nr:hypothetical protein AZ09_13990 [Acetobacter aceti 1023]